MMMTSDTRIIDMTIGDLQSIISAEISKMTLSSNNGDKQGPELIFYGIKGIMQALDCCRNTAIKRKNDYRYIQSGAIVQNSRTDIQIFVNRARLIDGMCPWEERNRYDD